VSDDAASAGREQLVVEELRKEYDVPDGTLAVLRDVSLTVVPGESVAILGPSGAGKSTLLNIIGTLDDATAGKVELGGTDIAGLSGTALSEFRSRRVGFVFQDHHLLPQCTALENVLVPTLACKERDGAAARAEELLDRVGLTGRMHDFPARLSGGERQRVAIARALINSPSLLLCDEPTGNLDRETGDQVAGLLQEIVRERDVMLILVTHDPHLAASADRRLELRDGRLSPVD
jgi:lipoprotein-releasing system ATP-binding protein